MITVIAIATALALVGHLWAGRLAGLAITAFCAFIMAYFFMPPAFSIQVSETRDIIALAFYGTLGLVIARAAPSRRTPAVNDAQAIAGEHSATQIETDLTGVVRDLLSTDLGKPLRSLDVGIPNGGFTLPCAGGEARYVLSDVLKTLLQISGVQHISICGGQLPGRRCITVTAHRIWPPPQYEIVTIGKHDVGSGADLFPGWPRGWRASSFDNGYDKVIQISISRPMA